MAKKSARHGRFFFFAPPCMVEENFTGRRLENASPLPVFFLPHVRQTIDKLK
ncbi:hypothetical protein PQR75_15590 [Paraburkholderia fungorum]|uniref:hypothetical protein n=1 Tax=Paraburkholderia fungorum TaxID=134537 RepID=UPI0038B933C3